MAPPIIPAVRVQIDNMQYTLQQMLNVNGDALEKEIKKVMEREITDEKITELIVRETRRVIELRILQYVQRGEGDKLISNAVERVMRDVIGNLFPKEEIE